jgi:hypothetical protein
MAAGSPNVPARRSRLQAGPILHQRVSAAALHSRMNSNSQAAAVKTSGARALPAAAPDAKMASTVAMNPDARDAPNHQAVALARMERAIRAGAAGVQR